MKSNTITKTSFSFFEFAKKCIDGDIIVLIGDSKTIIQILFWTSDEIKTLSKEEAQCLLDKNAHLSARLDSSNPHKPNSGNQIFLPPEIIGMLHQRLQELVQSELTPTSKQELMGDDNDPESSDFGDSDNMS